MPTTMPGDNTLVISHHNMKQSAQPCVFVKYSLAGSLTLGTQLVFHSLCTRSKYDRPCLPFCAGDKNNFTKALWLWFHILWPWMFQLLATLNLLCGAHNDLMTGYAHNNHPWQLAVSTLFTSLAPSNPLPQIQGAVACCGCLLLVSDEDASLPSAAPSPECPTLGDLDQI